MGAENPSSSVNPEPKEWRGQKWEYLAVDMGVVGGSVIVGLNIEHLIRTSPLSLYADELLEGAAEKKFAPFGKVLNILGTHGWRLVDTTAYSYGPPRVFFFERPVAPSE